MDSVEVVGYAQGRLTQLHALKQHRYLRYWQFRNEYKQAKLEDKKEDDNVKYGMNTAFAIVNSKAASILANAPKYDFAALDEKASRYKRVKEIFWEYVWETSNSSREVAKIVIDAMKYGTGFGLETVVLEKRKVKEPSLSQSGEVSFTEKEIVDYDGCKLSHISWDRVYVNGRNMEDASEAVVIDYLDRHEFLSKYSENPYYKFKESDIPEGKYYYVSQGQSELTIQGNPGSTDRKDSNVQAKDTVSILRYWNRYKDEYIVIANGFWINPVGNGQISPMINVNKEIPLVMFTDHYLEDDIYGLGEFDITEKSRRLKDTARSLAIEVVRAQAGIITIDPDSDFDEAVMEFGMRKYARVEKDKIGFFAPNINASTIQYIEAKADEDITIETGVDFRSMNSTSSETATHTQGRIQAQRERTALTMKMNAFSFYERLARLRMSNMKMWYGDKETKVPVKGVEVDGEGNATYVNNGYGLFTMKPEYFGGDVALIPRVESMVGDTSEDKRQEYLQMLQLLLPLVDPTTGKPLYDPRKLIEAGRGIIDKVIDIDKINEKTKATKTPEQILKDAGALDGTQTMGEPSSQNGGVIPPEQMSGKPVLLPSLAKQPA